MGNQISNIYEYVYNSVLFFPESENEINMNNIDDNQPQESVSDSLKTNTEINCNQNTLEIHISEQEVNQPEVNQPEVNEPEVNQPEVNQPEVNQPEVNQPEVNQPEVNKPEVNQPEVNQPNVKNSDSTILFHPPLVYPPNYFSNQTTIVGLDNDYENEVFEEESDSDNYMNKSFEKSDIEEDIPEEINEGLESDDEEELVNLLRVNRISHNIVNNLLNNSVNEISQDKRIFNDNVANVDIDDGINGLLSDDIDNVKGYSLDDSFVGYPIEYMSSDSEDVINREILNPGFDDSEDEIIYERA